MRWLCGSNGNGAGFFPPDKSASVISLLILILGASPMLAPTAGSFVMALFGWRSIFILLASVVLIILILIFFFLPHAQKPDLSVSLKPKHIITTFKNIFLLPQFYVYTLAGTFSFSGLFVYVAGSPAIFMDGFHVSAKEYGGIFALLSVGFIGSSQLNHILTRKYKSEEILRITSVIQTIASILFFTGVLNGWYGITATIIFLFIILSCAGLTYPNAAAIALAPFENNAGSASALLGFIQIGIGGLISSGIGFLRMKGSFPTSIIMAITSLIALIILLSGRNLTIKNMNAAIKVNAVH
jgi:DHA1 family bicyclomycin/chloramphenicol resistance-like MFS transporter